MTYFVADMAAIAMDVELFSVIARAGERVTFKVVGSTVPEYE